MEINDERFSRRSPLEAEGLRQPLTAVKFLSHVS